MPPFVTKTPKTVESITAGLSGMVADLQALAVQRNTDAEAARAEIARQQGLADSAIAEADRASATAAKISALFA